MTAMPAQHPASHLGRLCGLRRYPVKSLAGEVLDRVSIQERGLLGDRLWCVRDSDGKFGSGKSTRRFRKMDGLLSLAAHYDGETPVIEFADGRSVRGDDTGIHAALSAHVGRSVTLSRENGVSHFDEGPLHLLTTSTLDRLELAHGSQVDVRRLRPNLVLDTPGGSGFVEDSWIGRRIAIGSDVLLAIRTTMPRCVMVNLAQRDLPSDGGLLQTATRANGANIGVVAEVLSTGDVAVGDEARLVC